MRYSNLLVEADADSECSTLLSPPPSRVDPLNTSASSAAQSDFEESAQTGSRHTDEPARRWHPGRISTGQLSDMRNNAAAATEEIGAARSDEEEDRTWGDRTLEQAHVGFLARWCFYSYSACLFESLALYFNKNPTS